jgi:glyoxylase-like metal-dependent hydrolase (beta-lactamase superfamily II)
LDNAVRLLRVLTLVRVRSTGSGHARLLPVVAATAQQGDRTDRDLTLSTEPAGDPRTADHDLHPERIPDGRTQINDPLLVVRGEPGPGIVSGMGALRVGNARIDRVEEHSLPVSLRSLTDDEDFIARRVAPLPSGFLDRASMTFRFSNHTWVVRTDGLVVLIDPCTGNGRKGRGPYFDDLDTPYLEGLAEVGASADAVDVVFCTHLHHDHCGWNTVQVDGRWVPTFPNASYLFVDQEYRRWDGSNLDGHPNTFNPNVFDECVRPVVDAGQARIISVPHQISPSLAVETAPGHTVGHAMLRLDSDSTRAYFTGDAFHHPVQLTRPELHLPGCDDLPTAIATRQAVVERVLDERALLFPAHFPEPHFGRVAYDGDEVCFLPGGPENPAERASP